MGISIPILYDDPRYDTRMWTREDKKVPAFKRDSINTGMRRDRRGYKIQPGGIGQIVSFDSVNEMEEFLWETCKLGEGGGATVPSWGHHHDGDVGDDWAWGFSVRQMIQLSRMGWIGQVDKVGKNVVDIANSLLKGTGGEDTYYDVHGSCVDVGMLMTGIPECMMEFRNEGKTPKMLFLIDAFISGCMTGNRLANRGKAIVASIMALEAMGVMCDVEMFFYGSGHDGKASGNVCTKVTLHSGGRPIDMARFLTWVAHPGYTRHCLYLASDIVHGTGGLSPSGAKWAGDQKKAKKGVVIVPYGNDDAWKDEKSAMKAMQDLIAGTEKDYD